MPASDVPGAAVRPHVLRLRPANAGGRSAGG